MSRSAPLQERGSAPPLLQDPWAWVAAAAGLPLLARAAGAPLGEPFADDFIFIRHAMLRPAAWLDGGGAAIYWRPLARQGWFGLLGSADVRAPWLVASIQLLLIALACVLLHRALRARWPGPWAAAAASFPFLAEASRTFLLWPSSFQDLGAIAFSALAIERATRGRLGGSSLALAASLLCKETALVAALLVPWLPIDSIRRARGRWIVGMGFVVAAWGALYAGVLASGRVRFASELESPAAWSTTAPWALERTLRDALGLGALPAGARAVFVIATALVLALALLATLRHAPGRGRLRAAAPWIAWGMAWFLAGTALLTQVHPLWGPFRAAYPAIGLGVALVALTAAASPAALGALVGLRVIALLASPGPPSAVRADAEAASLDFESLARLSRFTRETRVALMTAHPALPRGATVAWRHRPSMAQHAFAHGEALHVWYRDTTLRWISWEDARQDSERRADVFLEYEPGHDPEVVALARPAVIEYLDAERELVEERPAVALARLRRADSLQSDRSARVFVAAIAGKRSLAQLALGDLDAARRESNASLAAWRDGGDARYVRAVLAILDGRLAAAHADLDSLLDRYPFDASGREMLDTVRARQSAARLSGSASSR